MGRDQEQRGFHPREVPDETVKEAVSRVCTRIECGNCGEYFWEIMEFHNNTYTECDNCGSLYTLVG